MEILILGLILVALMVYASTRIKRSAARAFEQETIETCEFVLVKPEGFLHVINGDPAYAFQAYSKKFGSEDASGQRHATANLRVIAGKNFEQACEEAKGNGKLLTGKNFQFDEMKASSIEIERAADGIEFIDHLFLIDTPKGVYELQTTVLREHNDELSRKINKMEESLTIKK